MENNYNNKRGKGFNFKVQPEQKPVKVVIPNIDNVFTDSKYFDDTIGNIMNSSENELSNDISNSVNTLLLQSCGYNDEDIENKSLEEKLKMLSSKMALLSPSEKGAVSEKLKGLGINKSEIEKVMITEVEKIFKSQDEIIKKNCEILEQVNIKIQEDKIEHTKLVAEEKGLKAKVKIMERAISEAGKKIESLEKNQPSEDAKPNIIAQYSNKLADAGTMKTNLITDLSETEKQLSIATVNKNSLKTNLDLLEKKYDEKLKDNTNLIIAVENKRNEIYSKFKKMGLERPNIAASSNSTKIDLQVVDNSQKLDEQVNSKNIKKEVVSDKAVTYVNNQVDDEILQLPLNERAKNLAIRFSKMSREELKIWAKGYGYESIEASLEYMDNKDKIKMADILKIDLRTTGETVDEFDESIKELELPKISDNIKNAIRNNNFSNLEVKDFEELSFFVDKYNSNLSKYNPSVLKDFDKKVMDRISRAALINRCEKDVPVGIKERFKNKFKRKTSRAFLEREQAEQYFLNCMTGHNKEKADRWRKEVEFNNSIFSSFGMQYNGPQEIANAAETRNKNFAKQDRDRNSAIR